MKTEHFCPRCAEPGNRENYYLCWKCTASGDDWGSKIMGLSQKVLSYIEKFQSEAVKQSAARRLTIAEFQDLIRRAKDETEKTLHINKADA